MPHYEYISENPDDTTKSCIVCRKPFELRRQMERATILKCPMCQSPVKKLVSQISPPSTEVTDTKAKKAGFTVLNNKGDGIFEKS